jgi:hypothetical protein
VIRKKRQKESLGETEGTTGRDRGSRKEQKEGVTKKRQIESLGETERVTKKRQKESLGETEGVTKKRQIESLERQREPKRSPVVDCLVRTCGAACSAVSLID